MKKNLTEIVFILDSSGSMAELVGDTVGGFNAMIAEQRGGSGEVLVSTVLFSSISSVLHDRVPLEQVPELTREIYRPRGCTALLDAVGDAVRHIRNVHRYIREEDRPEKTLFVITTDGMENASRRCTYAQVKQLIEEQTAAGWEFLFLGANIDAAREAARFGIPQERAADYHADGIGTAAVYEGVSEAIRDVRTKRRLNRSWRCSIDADYRHRKKDN